MRLSLVMGAVACGLVAAAVRPPSASACCIWLPEADRIARADVIFEGTALEGPTETGIQRFRVSRYLKSTGPEIISVKTDHRSNGSFIFASTSVSIHAEAGSEWRIFGFGSPDVVVATSNCVSKRLPLPPLGQEPLPPPPPPGTIFVQPSPPGDTPTAEDRSGTGTDTSNGDLTSAGEATPPLKTLKPRPKAKRLLSAKKKAKKGALRGQRSRRR